MNTRSLRFLFSSLPGYGHLHPLVPLARALQDRGHEVAFAAREFARARIESAGFRFFAIGGDREHDPENIAFKQQLARMGSGYESELFIYAKLFCGILPRLNTPGVVEACRTWQPQMLIREAGEYGAVIAAEYLGLPHATVAFAAALKTMSVFERDAARGLDPVRASWGLKPDPSLEALYRNLYLAYAPPGFGMGEVKAPHPLLVSQRERGEEAGVDTAFASPAERGDLPATTRFVRAELYDNTAVESFPAWVRELPDKPTVYVTLGTEVNGDPEFYPRVMATIIEGLRDAPINLIATLGRDKDPADFGVQPENVRIERYIPQSLLLPHCDLMVMHGGSNSVLAALDVGLPLVIVPLIADQFFNAHVTQNIGLGQVVGFDELTPVAIRAAVDKVLVNPSYRQVAGRLQKEMHALPDMSYAVELVERVGRGVI